MQNIMVNRKLWIFYKFSAPLRKCPIFLLFVFSLFLFCLDISNSNETETKNPNFCRFCLKTSLFVANNVLIFRDLHLYMANHTTPPPLLALAG